jgi:hypothetical protein
MERFFLILMCASVVLLTTAIGLASPEVDENWSAHVPLLLRIIPS